jgi:ABC-2 type transport system ATP-binding protein
MSDVTAPVEVRGVSKEFRSLRRRVRALDDVTLQVRRGEVFGLLGANGAGKTTLVKILLGLTAPTQGAVHVHGCDPRSPLSRLRVGYLPEGHRFPSYHSGVSALRFFGRLAGVPERTLEARIPELLELVGLSERGGDRIGRYSKGMTQRLGLAAALLDEPEILFLDEPTDGVDPVGRRHIREVLLSWRTRGTTIFINSHLLSEVERTCDRVAVLDRGRVVREGSVEELTRPVQRFRLRVAGDEAPLAAASLPDVTLVSVNGHVELEVAELDALNRTIDALRARGLLITAVAPLRSDLEEVFVALVGKQDGAP